ncbi:ABC transporter substrate-binding protein [Leucobacter iarius]|uniref:ABC transporter substrate-binding protein n=1 Tax=Leucobacter iarius TaxID=333963 RepID=A0ABP4Y149_9MICO
MGRSALAAVAILVACVLAVPSTASAVDGGSVPGNGADTLTIGTTDEIDTINPMLGYMSSTQQEYLWDPLTASSRTEVGEAAPGLAESWDVSPDGLTVTYRLRPGLKWSDGKPLTSADPQYMLSRIAAGGPGQGMWGNFLDSVTSVSAPDDRTVQLHLSVPNSMMPRMPIPILPKHVLEKYPDTELSKYPIDPAHLVTSGAYRLIEGGPGSSVLRFEANPGYWRGESPVKHVNWRFFKAEDTVMQAIMKGEIDYTSSVNALQLRVLETQPNIRANQFPQIGTFREIGFNTGSIDTETGKPMGDPNPAVLDPKFRHALSTAFDREAVAHKAYKGGMTPLKTVVGAGFDRFRWEVPPSDPSDYDPELAAERLDAAGYRLGADGKRTLPNGKPVGQLRLLGDSGNPSALQTVQLVREWLQNLGFDVKVTAMRMEKLNDVVLSGDFDMFEQMWGIDDDPDSILMYFTCAQRGLMSDSWYCSKEFDALYASQKRELDPARRIETIRRMQELLYRDAPYIVLGNLTARQAYRVDRWHGWTPALQRAGDVMADVVSLFSLRPGGVPGSSSGTGGPAQTSALVYGSIGGLLVVGALARFIVVRRRRATAEERE